MDEDVGDAKKRCVSLSFGAKMEDNIKQEQSEDEDVVEIKIEPEDEMDRDGEEQLDDHEELGMQDDNKDNWTPSSKTYPPNNTVSKSGPAPSPVEEVLLPLVWCGDCKSGFTRDCLRKYHRRLYGCLRCASTKPSQGDTGHGGQQPVKVREESLDDHEAEEKEHLHKVKDQVESELIDPTNQKNCGGQKTVISNHQAFCNTGHQEPALCSERRMERNSTQANAMERSQTVALCNSNLEVSGSDDEEVGTQETLYIDTQGRTCDRHHVGMKNSNQENSSRYSEAPPDDILSQPLHVENLAVLFNSLNDFKVHAMQHHGIFNFRDLCANCGKFITMVNSADGGTLHVCEQKLKPIICPDCGRRFGTEIGFQTHNRRFHGEKHSTPPELEGSGELEVRPSMVEPPMVEPPMVWCTNCNAEFTRSCYRLRHKRSYGCLHCGTRDGAQRHANAGSQESNASNNQDDVGTVNRVHGPVHFQELAVCFGDLESFQKHARQRHGVKQFREPCPDCGKFITLRNKVSGGPPHVCEHKSRPISCHICSKGFASQKGLLSHMSWVHLKGKPNIVRCNYCLKRFKFRKQKIEHEKIHQNEELKFSCPHCPLRFPDCYSRSAHRKTHRIFNTVTCKVCDQTFKQACSLDRHMAIHTGLKPYSCKLCDRTFNQSGHLKSHMRVHTGERPFKCQECGQCFNHNVSLKNHVQRKHKPRPEEWAPGQDDAGE
ncbi:hypothetical protein ACEWY4_006167 [Coilia grayii]|uniref:C2H2-type domain-containing protein n=1 Tax=Coilia grayii TaxID=363190 RepID=A0ABD1KCR6_9TELE